MSEVSFSEMNEMVVIFVCLFVLFCSRGQPPVASSERVVDGRGVLQRAVQTGFTGEWVRF